MKKQPDLILLSSEDFSNNYSILKFRKLVNSHIHRTTRNLINPPLSTEYKTINFRETSSNNKKNMKKSFPKKIIPLSLISKHGLLYDTNRLLTLNKNSLEGFKPIEDNKIRNKLKIKNLKNSLCIQNLSLNERNDQFDKYLLSLLKKNKNLIFQNKRYITNSDEYFTNDYIKKKLCVLNSQLDKTYEKHKKQFKKYYYRNNEYLKDVLTTEILNKTYRLKLTNNENYKRDKLFTLFSPKPKKISLKTSLIKDYVISYETLNNVQNDINFNKY